MAFCALTTYWLCSHFTAQKVLPTALRSVRALVRQPNGLRVAGHVKSARSQQSRRTDASCRMASTARQALADNALSDPELAQLGWLADFEVKVPIFGRGEKPEQVVA